MRAVFDEWRTTFGKAYNKGEQARVLSKWHAEQPWLPSLTPPRATRSLRLASASSATTTRTCRSITRAAAHTRHVPGGSARQETAPTVCAPPPKLT